MVINNGSHVGIAMGGDGKWYSVRWCISALTVMNRLSGSLLMVVKVNPILNLFN
ncbi:hypothetical protein KSX25_04505 [Acinetobacter baumannii]|nr:hypothetical protein [Acinetobacter baumannii]